MSAQSAGTPDRWRLDSVTVTDFRGVLGTQIYQFAGLPALVWGDNGVGKSTLALAIEWTLFGGFPSQVLGVPRDNFMSSVGGGAKAYKGEVVFRRGSERLVVRRDAEESVLVVESGGRKRRGDEAAALLDEILGLDKDTFVRAVLLQQSKIRGLLLDEPKERAKALDRLLGMRDVEAMLDIVKPKAFKDAADAWREQIKETESHFQSQQEMLAAEYEATQNDAREHKFLNKDLTELGLKSRYADLSREIAKVGSKYGVEVIPLPAAERVSVVKKVSRAVENVLREIRLGAEIRRKLVGVEKRLSSLEAFAERWDDIVALRDAAQKEVSGIGEKHGDAKAIAKRRQELEADIAARQESLRRASELRSLLAEAQAYFEDPAIETCPVCEQPIGAPSKLQRRLIARIESMTTKSVQDIEKDLKKAQNAHTIQLETAKRLAQASKVLSHENSELESERKKVMTFLAIEGLLEKKVAAALAKATVATEGEREQVANGVETMEKDLELISDRERALRDGLVPFLVAREKVADHEVKWKKAKEGYAAADRKASELEFLAIDCESIRKALLAAKEEIATETLGKAGPRAQELYGKLVQHPLFDTLEVKTTVRANKVDYSFEVSSSTVPKSAREARLVLSDGQMTAAALALFFSLAESSQHSLDVLYIDDPTQNLDHRRKEAMAKVVADLSSRKQLVVSTQDEDFVTLLRDTGFDQHSVVHHITGWDRSPEVTTAMPKSR